MKRQFILTAALLIPFISNSFAFDLHCTDEEGRLEVTLTGDTAQNEFELVTTRENRTDKILVNQDAAAKYKGKSVVKITKENFFGSNFININAQIVKSVRHPARKVCQPMHVPRPGVCINPKIIPAYTALETQRTATVTVRAKVDGIYKMYNLDVRNYFEDGGVFNFVSCAGNVE